MPVGLVVTPTPSTAMPSRVAVPAVSPRGLCFEPPLPVVRPSSGVEVSCGTAPHSSLEEEDGMPSDFRRSLARISVVFLT